MPLVQVWQGAVVVLDDVSVDMLIVRVICILFLGVEDV